MTGARILVVNDEPQILRALRTSLSGRGYQVTTAPAGEVALDDIAAAPPDVIILDLGLPDMEGHEVVRRVREFSHVPIIVLSVRDSERDKIQALDLGADDYLGRLHINCKRPGQPHRCFPTFVTQESGICCLKRTGFITLAYEGLIPLVPFLRSQALQQHNQRNTLVSISCNLAT